LGWTQPNHPGWAGTGLARPSWVGPIEGPTNAFLGWTGPDPASLGPHGCWPGPITMLNLWSLNEKLCKG